MKVFISTLLLILISNTNLFSQLIFNPHTIATNEDGASSVYAVDLDGDRDVDVIASVFIEDKVVWYENDGVENFTPHTITNITDGAISVYAIDLDGDLDIDVLSASEFDSKIAWYENDGYGNFIIHVITTSPGGPYSIYAIDVDGDLDVDLVSAAVHGDEISWHENEGTQNFTKHTITASANGAYSVFSLDLDDDGDIDVLSASYEDDKVAWYENDGNENFSTHIITTSADGAVSVYATDVDMDGDIDVFSASLYDNKVAYYKNDGNENFTEHIISVNAGGASSVFAIDLDRDNDVDILAALYQDNKIAWYENDGNENFREYIISNETYGAIDVFAADVDNDSYIDVLSASWIDQKITWYENPLLPDTLRVPSEYSTIQSAVEAACDEDVVLVARGKYFENIDFKGKGIIVTSNFIISGDLKDIDSTIIDGSQPNNTDSASCVRIYKNDQSFADDTSAALIGFTLTGGEGTIWEDEHGIGNFYREGGGILIQYCSPRILFNIIRNNKAYNKTGVVSAGGGAVRCGDGNPLISNNIIINNQARYGGGIVLNYSGAVLRNNVIAYNYGGDDYSGGGLWILGNRFDNKIKVIENNTITNNSSILPGGGIYLWDASENFIRNNIIWGNSAPSNQQIRLQQSSGQIIYNNVEGGWTGEGNINLNPEFEFFNFYLSGISPCIDSGKDSIVFNDPEDPGNPGYAFWPSKGTIRNDMGAYGGPNRSNLPPIVTTIENDFNELISERFNLYQNYPNPFNPATIIKYFLQHSVQVTIKIYDILGSEIETLVNEYKPAGTYEVTLYAENLPSGVYFYQLRAGEFISTKKMILLK